MIVEQAIQAIRACEDELREFLREAAAQGDYEAVLELTELARQLSLLVQAPAAPLVGTGPGPSGEAKQESPVKRKAAKAATRPGKKRGDAYPIFARSKDSLLKTGWSKKDRKEYEHRAPCQVIELLRDRMMEIGHEEELFTTDDLFPIMDPDGGEVPSYQAYLCLAWMRSSGLILQHGRSGYTIPNIKKFIEAVQRQFEELPKRKKG